MARNVEIKYRVENIDLILERATAIADEGAIGSIQIDLLLANVS